jgi:hypothetical protein
VALADGRLAFIGRSRQERRQRYPQDHHLRSVTESWLDRDVPQVKVDFLDDPEGEHPDARDEANTDPEHPSDMG